MTGSVWQTVDGGITGTMSNDALAAACSAWQQHRDASSLIRAAARVIAGVPHYFQADFIAELEERARRDHAALVHASTLMTSLVKGSLRTVEEWRAETGVGGGGQASRGIAAKPADSGIDAEIERAVTKPGATLNMPLWGFSLSEDVARGFGDRFLFRLQGRFSALPAWLHSGLKDAEQEMIGGGGYRVLGTRRDGDTLIVDLKQLAVPMYDAHDLDRLLEASNTGAGD